MFRREKCCHDNCLKSSIEGYKSFTKNDILLIKFWSNLITKCKWEYLGLYLSNCSSLVASSSYLKRETLDVEPRKEKDKFVLYLDITITTYYPINEKKYNRSTEFWYPTVHFPLVVDNGQSCMVWYFVRLSVACSTADSFDFGHLQLTSLFLCKWCDTKTIYL